jgi:DNA-binding MarR family transcriptional regulator
MAVELQKELEEQQSEELAKELERENHLHLAQRITEDLSAEERQQLQASLAGA